MTDMLISIILPTYNEAENLPIIIPRIFNILEKAGIAAEVIVIDDNSPDGTGKIAQRISNKYPVKVNIRKNKRGLGTAILKGLQMARGEICVVMDTDLSHPVEAIPDMIKLIIEKKADMTLGSRYIEGGGFQDSSFIRKTVSKVAGLLARGITTATDPTSGFMAIRKSILKDTNLDPISWKLPLEIIVKCRPRVVEVPIIFTTRQKGKSKLNLKVSLKYLQHLFNLYCYRFLTIFEIFKFCLVGIVALIIDTAVLISCVELLFLDPRLSAVFAFIVAATVIIFLTVFGPST